MHNLKTYNGSQERIKKQYTIIQIKIYSYQELLILNLEIAILVCIKESLSIFCCDTTTTETPLG